jgi:hypothetical protein
MARSTKKARTLLAFNHPIKIEVRESEFEWFDSVRHLDVAALAKAARTEIEIGEVKSACCHHLVRAVIQKGMVTGLRVGPESKTGGTPMTPELVRMLKVVHRKLLARRKAATHFPYPIQEFMTANVARLTIQTLSCIQICLFGWCIACCWTDTAMFCGRVTIDTTTGPYPEPG